MCYLCCFSFKDLFTITCSSLDLGLCSSQASWSYLPELSLPTSLMNYCNNLPFLRQVSTKPCVLFPQVSNTQWPKISEPGKQSNKASSFFMLEDRVTLGSQLAATSASGSMSLSAGETLAVSGSHVVILEIWHLGEGSESGWVRLPSSDRLLLLLLLHNQSYKL